MTIKTNDTELFIRGLAIYFGMTVPEFAEVIGNDPDKLLRFYLDYKYNHN